MSDTNLLTIKKIYPPELFLLILSYVSITKADRIEVENITHSNIVKMMNIPEKLINWEQFALNQRRNIELMNKNRSRDILCCRFGNLHYYDMKYKYGIYRKYIMPPIELKCEKDKRDKSKLDNYMLYIPTNYIVYDEIPLWAQYCLELGFKTWDEFYQLAKIYL
jgi:hypothetical protein